MAGEIQISGNIGGILNPAIINSSGQITTPPSSTGSAGLNIPLGTPPTSPNPGDVFTDTNRKNIGICGISGGSPAWMQACVQTQPQQTPQLLLAGAPSTVCSFNSLDAGILNSVGKRLIITGSGMYTTVGGEVPTITLKLFLLTKALVTFVSDAVTAALANMPFLFHFEALTQTVGATGVVRGTGWLHLTTNTGVVKTYLYSPDVPTTLIDLTSAGAPLIQATANVTQLTQLVINETSLHITN